MKSTVQTRVKTSQLSKHDKVITTLSGEIKYLQTQRLEAVNEIISDVINIAKTDAHIAQMEGKAKKRLAALSVAGKLIELNLLNEFKWRVFKLSELELVLRTNEAFIKRLHKAHKNKDASLYSEAFISAIKAEAQVTVSRPMKRYDKEKLAGMK